MNSESREGSDQSRPQETILACAAETDRRAAVWSAAVTEAAQRQARLILYDVDSASALVDPLPEIDPGRFAHPLSATELRTLGRNRIADQVEQAAARGVTAFGWLPRHHGADAMLDYAREVGATTVMLSAQLESPTFIQRVRHLTATRAQAQADPSITVLLVPDDPI